MRFTITLDRDEDGVWIVECPSIPGCVSQGATKHEAVRNIKDAIQQCLEVRLNAVFPYAMMSADITVAEFLKAFKRS